MAKIKKAQKGGSIDPMRTHEGQLNKWRPENVGAKTTGGIDSSARRNAVSAGLFREDKSSGDLIPTEKYLLSKGRRIASPQTSGGVSSRSIASLKRGGKITKVPNGPLVKKKGPYAGSTLKKGGKISKKK